MFQTHHIAARAEGFKGSGFAAELFGVVIDGLDGKADTAFDAVHFDHAGSDFITHLDHILHAFHMVFAQLGDMNQAVNIAVQIHKGAEAGNLGHLASHHIAHLEAVIDGFPRIGLKLLDTKGDVYKRQALWS